MAFQRLIEGTAGCSFPARPLRACIVPSLSPSLSTLQLPCATVHAASALPGPPAPSGPPAGSAAFLLRADPRQPFLGEPGPGLLRLLGDAEGGEHTDERFRRVQEKLQHGDEMGLSPGRHRTAKPFPPCAQKRPRCEPQSPAPCLPPLGFPWMKAPQSAPSFVCGKRSPADGQMQPRPSPLPPGQGRRADTAARGPRPAGGSGPAPRAAAPSPRAAGQGRHGPRSPAAAPACPCGLLRRDTHRDTGLGLRPSSNRHL